MSLQFSDSPGSRERHLQRQYNNPLFSIGDITPDRLKQAQDDDLAELKSFGEEFQALFEQATKLDANVQSDVILKLKSDADRLYEQAAGLPGNNTEAQDALLRLIDVVMQAVRHGAGDDPRALSEIEQETQAREMQKQLLTLPLVVDLLRPDSAITPENLAASMLSASEEELYAALQLFEREHIVHLYDDAKQLINDCLGKGHDIAEAVQKLEIIARILDTTE